MANLGKLSLVAHMFVSVEPALASHRLLHNTVLPRGRLGCSLAQLAAKGLGLAVVVHP